MTRARSERRRAARRRDPILPAGTPGPVAPRADAWTWRAAALVALAACVVYLNSLDGALLYDDSNAIVRNTWVERLDPVGIATHASWWREGHGRGWRPVATLSFALNHAVHGLAPFGYHLVNVVLHAGVSVLVLAVFARVIGAAAPALIAALLFATHPVHTEAVASVVGRAELLAAAGFFLAWLLFARSATSRHPPLLVAAGVAVFFLAALAKENALTLLPVLVLADCLHPAAGGVGATLRRHLPRYLALLGAAVLYALCRGVVLGADPPRIDALDNPLVALDTGARLMTAIKVVALYAARLLVPVRLAADYSYAQIGAVASPLDLEFLAGVAILGGVGAAVWWAWRRLPALALGFGTMALTFAIVANLVVPIGTIMAERLVYLPSAGFCLAAGVLLVRSLRGRALLAVLAVVVALYAVRTWTRNEVWRDPESFFTTMVAEAPRSARAQREYGSMLADRGRYDEARAAFERSLAIKPGDAATVYNLGNALMQAGDVAGAVDAYQQAIAAKPDFVDALSNLGNAESMRGDQDAALAAMRRALALAPRSAGLRMNIANTLFRKGAIEEARAAYQEALALDPDSPQLLANYGAFLYAHGEYEAALTAYTRGAEGGDPLAFVGLAASHRALGNRAAALAAQAEAERRFPRHGAVRQMGEVLQRDAAGEAAP